MIPEGIFSRDRYLPARPNESARLEIVDINPLFVLRDRPFRHFRDAAGKIDRTAVEHGRAGRL